MKRNLPADMRKTEHLLAELANAPVPLEDAQASFDRRRQVVARITMRMGEADAHRERRSSWVTRGRWLAASGATAAAAWAVLHASSWHQPDATHLSLIEASHGEVRVERADGPAITASPSGRTWNVRDTLLTGFDGWAEARLRSGARVQVQGGSKVQLLRQEGQEMSENLALAEGTISLQVPNLPEGTVLTVQTPEAQVTVHGTQFEVQRHGTSTSVRVIEGRVSVHQAAGDLVLPAGTSWSSESILLAGPPPPAPPPSLSGQHDSPSARAKKKANALRDPSTLGAENTLLQNALRQRAEAQHKLALASLDTLLWRYPQSPLLEEAYAERFRTLARMGDAAAATQGARAYLTRYPTGFAQEEARQLALPDKP